LFFDKSIEDNASVYYEKAKRAKRKLEGLKKAIESTEAKIKRFKEGKLAIEKEEAKRRQEAGRAKRVKKWYEKFRWFFSSEGFLCIGGRDATTNDIIIKKYTDKDDLVFHTQIIGSPFFVVKSEGKEIGKATIEEAAEATAAYSRAWRQGLTSTEVYYIKPEQVKKELGLPKGTFMIYGKRNYLRPALRIAIGKTPEGIIGGPVSAVASKTKNYFIITPGDKKVSEVLKLLSANFKESPDEIQGFLPSGKYNFG